MSQHLEDSMTELHGTSAGQPGNPHFPEKGSVRCIVDGLAYELPVSVEEAPPHRLVGIAEHGSLRICKACSTGDTGHKMI